MTQPPRLAERLLGGLSGRTAFSEGVFGDLSEEFARRALRDGGGPARRWYYREALRSAPHILGNALRTYGHADFLNVAKCLFFAWVIVILLMVLTNIVDTVGVVHGFDIVLRGRHVLGDKVDVAISDLAVVGIAVVGGAVAARHAMRAPIVVASAFGANVFAVVTLLLTAAGHPPPGLNGWLALAALYLPTALAGGVLQVASGRTAQRLAK
jgi:hypothetical protein